MKYQLLDGIHSHIDQKEVDGKKVDIPRILRQGEVLETDVDMLKFNGAGMSPKWGLVQFGDAEKLAAMSDDELQEFCEAEEIDISGCKNRQEIIAKIRSNDPSKKPAE